jgi:isocitrate dehydrogenase (NAD+)
MPEPGGPHPVTVIPGDGVGPEVIAAAREVIDATGVSIDWDVQTGGRVAFERTGTALPEATVASIQERGTALKGPLTTPSDRSYRSPSIALREALGLYVGVRPCKSMAGVPAAVPGVDLVVVRMLLEDLYAGIEFADGDAETERLRALVSEATGRAIAPDAGITVKPISRTEAERAITAAFEYARATGRAKVTAVHKATVMRETDGLFLEAARKVAAEHPAIALDEGLVDAVSHGLVMRPEDYDVLATPMMYGDILSDIGAGLIGGLGLAPGANYGDRCAVFEPVHGSAPRRAGQDRANPIAAILSGAMMLHHLDEAEAGRRVERAVEEVVGAGETLTYDLRRAAADREPATTTAVAAAVAEAVAA